MSAPYPPYQQPAGNGSAIALTTKFFPLAFIFFFIKPFVSLNGQQLPQSGWGRTVIPVPPGQHQLHVHTPYFLPPQLGPADLTVPVAPGQTVELEYRAPAFAFSPGALGAPPQKYNGMWVTWVALGLVALIIICCCGASILNAAGNH
ncbi:MAG TPA: hypothetical protein VJT31_30550 [Rugosimonospora sp.]|nr:hypothetical protein [Rugosimonospora sp.]